MDEILYVQLIMINFLDEMEFCKIESLVATPELRLLIELS
jgi:hypothetical protein